MGRGDRASRDGCGLTDITFEAFPKIPRISRGCVITEKIDGTNAQVIVTDDGRVGAASRTRLITPEDDNMGFATWVKANEGELVKLGPGRHFGEWYGQKIQRTYGLTEKRFALFNTGRWLTNPDRPACCGVVPLLHAGEFTDAAVNLQILRLRAEGSVAVPGFMRPEGIVIYHVAARQMFKKLLENDELPKGQVEAA